MTDKSHRNDRPNLSRRRLMGASALTAAGWIAGGGGWMLAPKRASAADPCASSESRLP